ncbi:MAG: TVP38/TMEM64 family protein [Myxococcales bacterium FL481]|nr:MAG: TVP38/TMEM64 family protein [Myxococcales bacterium FL481]
MDPARRRLAYLRFAIGFAGWVAATTLFLSGTYEAFSIDGARAFLEANGPWGPLAFVAIFAGLQPWGLSAHILVITAGMVWSPLAAVPLSMLGALGASTTAYGFANYFGREWVQARLPERLRAYDDRLRQRGLTTVVVLRLFCYTFAPLQFLFGVSSVRLSTVLLGSLIGLLPGIAIEVLLGAEIYEWLTG